MGFHNSASLDWLRNHGSVTVKWAYFAFDNAFFSATYQLALPRLVIGPIWCAFLGLAKGVLLTIDLRQ
jgi:hypothetical protein